MKKIVLLTALIIGAFQAVQADNVVHYDTQDAEKAKQSKPNYPNDDIYPSK